VKSLEVEALSFSLSLSIFLIIKYILIIESQGREMGWVKTSWLRKVRKRKESCRLSVAIERKRKRERKREEAENLYNREASDSPRCKKTNGKERRRGKKAKSGIPQKHHGSYFLRFAHFAMTIAARNKVPRQIPLLFLLFCVKCLRVS